VKTKLLAEIMPGEFCRVWKDCRTIAAEVIEVSTSRLTLKALTDSLEGKTFEVAYYPKQRVDVYSDRDEILAHVKRSCGGQGATDEDE